MFCMTISHLAFDHFAFDHFAFDHLILISLLGRSQTDGERPAALARWHQGLHGCRTQRWAERAGLAVASGERDQTTPASATQGT